MFIKGVAIDANHKSADIYYWQAEIDGDGNMWSHQWHQWTVIGDPSKWRLLGWVYIEYKQNQILDFREKKNNTAELIHWWQNGTVLDNSHTGKKAPSRARESDLSLCCFCVRKSIDNLLCTAPVRANTATLYIERPVMQLYITIRDINDIWLYIICHTTPITQITLHRPSASKGSQTIDWTCSCNIFLIIFLTSHSKKLWQI